MAVESKSQVARLLAQNRRQKTTITWLNGEVDQLTAYITEIEGRERGRRPVSVWWRRFRSWVTRQ